MRHFKFSLAFIVAGLCVPAASAQDAVEELRQAIAVRREDSAKPSDLLLKRREEALKKRVDALSSIGDLRRALLLNEWKGNTAFDFKLLEQNVTMRVEIGKRLQARLKAVADKTGPQNATSRLAVANLIGEFGPDVPWIEKDNAGFARTLTPIIVKLASDPDIGVKQEALRALGTINAVPAEATKVLRSVLANRQEALGPRRVAADSLGQLMRVMITLEKSGGGAEGVARPALAVDTVQKLETIKEVTDTASAALGDSDTQVRALGLEAIQLAAQSLSEMVDIRQRLQPQAPLATDRALTPDEVKAAEAQQALVVKDIAELQPGLSALDNQGPNLLRVLREAEPRVQVAAMQALESLGYVRLRLRTLAKSVPALKGEEIVPQQIPEPIRKALVSSDPLGKFTAGGGVAEVARLLPLYRSQAASENSIRIRRVAMDFLATLEDDVAPVLTEIVGALSDPDRFVRWTSVTVLEHIAPDKRVAAVPGLAQLLTDYDLNVRLEAIRAISMLGKRAAAARPALIDAISWGDVEGRVAAVRALEAVGLVSDPENADTKQALSNLISALSNSDPRVRRIAAESLGRRGPLARSAVPALRARVGDDDEETRTRASEALLSILEGK